MFLAAIENAIRPLNPIELAFVGMLLLGALFAYLRYFQRLAIQGPQTRPDLLGLPEMLAGILIMALLGVTVIARSFGAPAAPPNLPLDRLLLDNMANMALPALAIIVLLLARGGSLGSVFGIRKVGLFRAIAVDRYL